MSADFKQMVERILRSDGEFNWPRRKYINQSLEYMLGLYERNIRNNLFYHCEKRLNSFLRMCVYKENKNWKTIPPFDGFDIRNAKKDLLFCEDWTEGDENRKFKMTVLYDYVKAYCGPLFEKRQHRTLYTYIDGNWFESLLLFINMQRDIHDFNDENEPLVEQWLAYRKSPETVPKPTEPMPPKVKNFTVIPLNHYKLHHIRFDHSSLVEAVRQLDAAPTHMKGRDGKGLSFESEAYYMNNRDEAWTLLFKMEKIKEMANERRDQKFHHQILCDSVSASVVYDEPKQPESEPNSKFFAIKGKFVRKEYDYYVPLDPGVIIKLAGIRINPKTQTEVSCIEFD